MVYDEVR